MIEAQPYQATFSVDYDDYMLALQKGHILKGVKLTSNRKFTYKKIFKALYRKDAVNRACQWYWKALKGEWGQAHQILTVGDHYSEVRYNDDFSCSDKAHRYLDETTILLLLKEADGELIREGRLGDKHHPTNPVKRTKRRRKYLHKVAHSIYQSPSSGILYFAQTTVPQISKDGEIVQKRKRENFKLVSKDLNKAAEEIERRFKDK